MFRQKRFTRSFMIIASLAVVALLLVGVVESAAAQGPGGGGNGRGNGRGNGGGNWQGNANQNQLLQDGSGLGNQNGNGNGQGSGQLAGGMGLGNCDADCLADTLPPATPGELPADVITALNAGLQDEYNAYATYQVVIDQFGAVRPFSAIQQSEAHHIDMLAFLFERYGLAVPAAQSLYLVPTFSSVTEACAAGAAAEIANFGLYDGWIATVQDYPDIVEVFTQLRDASEFQHLPAFERCAG